MTDDAVTCRVCGVEAAAWTGGPLKGLGPECARPIRERMSASQRARGKAGETAPAAIVPAVAGSLTPGPLRLADLSTSVPPASWSTPLSAWMLGLRGQRAAVDEARARARELTSRALEAKTEFERLEADYRGELAKLGL